MKKWFVFTIALLLISSFTYGQAKLSGKLVIFHAGSLSVPMKQIAVEFNKLYPDVKILMESAGSVASARKITDLDRPCDIMASADYSVIDNMLIPQFTDWNIKFVSNEMSIVYTPESRYSNKINDKNWYLILNKKDVNIGRADPNADPCGYRTVLMLKLAEKHYNKPSLAKYLLTKDQQFIRPKEVDLIALLENNSLDYIFLYKSVAIQHGLKYIQLPDEINLRNPSMSKKYATVSTEINGSEPGAKVTIKGEPMIYGLTILRNAPNKRVAEAFVKFLLEKDKGMRIMEKNGQPSVIATDNKYRSKIPETLRKLVN